MRLLSLVRKVYALKNYQDEQEDSVQPLSDHPHNYAMAAVYKALSKTDSKKDDSKSTGGLKENRQRVLMLSSRGVTYRFAAAGSV
jgi:hypothetical protein